MKKLQAFLIATKLLLLFQSWLNSNAISCCSMSSIKGPRSAFSSFWSLSSNSFSPYQSPTSNEIILNRKIDTLTTIWLYLLLTQWQRRTLALSRWSRISSITSTGRLPGPCLDSIVNIINCSQYRHLLGGILYSGNGINGNRGHGYWWMDLCWLCGCLMIYNNNNGNDGEGTVMACPWWQQQQFTTMATARVPQWDTYHGNDNSNDGEGTTASPMPVLLTTTITTVSMLQWHTHCDVKGIVFNLFQMSKVA